MAEEKKDAAGIARLNQAYLLAATFERRLDASRYLDAALQCLPVDSGGG